MWIKKAEFVKSSSEYTACPKPDRPEFAFIGRSNVGKSSIINRMAGINKLAKISSMPGKTALINHFLINDDFYLVDLPGYGFAKTSKTTREKWDRMIRDYLLNRKNLVLVILLIDVRIPAQESDVNMMKWLINFKIPFIILFTKADKLSHNVLTRSYESLVETFSQALETDIWYFIVSAKTGLGVDEASQLILERIESFRKRE